MNKRGPEKKTGLKISLHTVFSLHQVSI